MSIPPASQPQSTGLAGDDEIDLRDLASALKRHWPWIAGSGALGIAISWLILLDTKPVYQGEFQIMVSDGNASAAGALMSQNSALAQFAGLDGGSDSIATELQILSSPSVLLPVFEAVKSSKPPEVAKAMRFQSWAKSAITAESAEGTSVLNVEFRDTNKELVLPITQLISQAYQSYSNRGRSRELTNLIDYLKTQIEKTKIELKASTRAAIDYGYANELSLLDGLPLVGSVAGAGVSQSGAGQSAASGGIRNSVEGARSITQQKVRALQVQIRAAQTAGSGSIYFASQLGAMTDKSSTFDQLTAVETKLAELRSRLKDNDPLVKKLQRRRASLVLYINQQTISLLKGELELAQAQLRALYRPKKVLARHRELTQKALRDEATLVTLENQLKQYELEQARASRPWELISTPTVLDKPVSPRRNRTLALGLFAGLVFGSGGALVGHRSTGRVFSRNELCRDLPGPLLESLPSNRNNPTKEMWRSQIQLLADGPLRGSSSVALIPVGEPDEAALDCFANKLRLALGSTCELIVSRDLLETRSASTQLLITAPGAAKRAQLRQLREQLDLQSSPVAGWVLLEASSVT